MPGKPINQPQVNLYMSYRNKPKQTQSSAAAKAGFSSRTARRIDARQHNTTKLPRRYATRKDPLNGLFEQHIVPLLENEPSLQPITLFEKLEEIAPGQFDRAQLRTLQRRIKKWRVKYGPEQEVIFRQQHTPGSMGISDYTWANELNITLSGTAFKHKLYHYRLVFSGWTYVEVILGGESFESLSSGLQNAFWQSGGVPKTHRTDSLSAAFKNHTEAEVLTERYTKLCKHYGVKATRNNKGVAHENGAIEGPNGHLKRKIEQQLLLRESRDFLNLKQYRAFVDVIVAKINRQCHTRYLEECAYLSALPVRRTHDFCEQYVKVTSSSTLSIKRVTYSVPSRLIGVTLLAHIFDDRLVLFYGHEITLTLARIHTQGTTRGRSIDYQHLIHALAKKRNAFKASQLRDDLIPKGDFWQLWQKLTHDGVTDADCHYMVDLLVIAANYDCEAALGRFVLRAFEAGKVVTIDECRRIFSPDTLFVPMINSQQHSVSSYDVLLGGRNG
jgi:hypothetical protein